MFLANAPQPPDVRLDKPICVHTSHGEVYIGADFKVDIHMPFPGFVRITDGDRIFWFNMNELIWIGPR